MMDKVKKMVDQLELLKQLQAIDGELYRLRRTLAQQPRELEAAKTPLAAQEAAVKAAEDRLRVLQLAQKEKEIDLQSREGNITKLQSQLFQVKTNKEYSAMQREIDSLKVDKSVLEETILKSFDAIEEGSKARQKEQARLSEEQSKFTATKARLDQEAASLAQRMGELELSRKALLPDVPAEAFKVYDRILSIRDGLALVPIVKDSCGGCNRRLPPQVMNQALLRAALVTCESCSRILFFDDNQSRV